MAQETKRRRVQFKTLALQKEEEKEQPKSALRIAGDVVRTAAERSRGIAALAARLGSGALSNAGGAVGAGIAGGGEALAQLLEGTGDDGINWGRVGVESAIGAVPFGKAFKAGKFLVSAAKGAGLSGAGVVGRKAADVATGTDPDALKKWSKWDALPVVLGGGMSGVIGKYSKAPVAKVDDTPYGPETINDFLAKKKWNADRIGTEAAKMEAGGYKDAAHGLRVASLETNTGNEKIYGDIAKTNERAAKQKALTGKQAAAAEEAAAKIRAKEAADAKKIQDAANAARRVEELKAGLEPQTPTVRESASKVEDGVRTSASQSFKAPKPDAEEGGEALPKAPRGPRTPKGPSGPPPVSPKPGMFQLVQDGKVIAELEDEADVLKLINAAGPGNKIQVVKPASTKTPDVPQAPKAETPFNPPRMVEGAPSASSRIAKVAETDKALDDLDSIQELTGGSGAASVAGRGTMPAEPPAPSRIPTMADAVATPEVQTAKAKFEAEAERLRAEVLAKAEAAKGGVAPSTEEGPKLSAPLALRVAQESEAPEGTEFMRFFRNRDRAQLAQEYANKLPDNVQRLLLPILAKYEAAGKKSLQARDFGELLSKMRGELNLPTRPTMPKAGVRLAAGAGKIQEPPKTPKVTAKAPEVPVKTEAPEVKPESTSTKLDFGTSPEADVNAAMREYELQQLLNKLPAEATDARQPLESELNTILKNRAQGVEAAHKEVEPIASKLNGDGGTTIGFGLGGANDIGRIIQQNPELAGGLIGAGAGAAVDEDNRLRGALLGGAAGTFGAKGLKGAKNQTINPEAPPPLMDRLVNWQRFSLLSNPANLIINTAAPTGGGTLGSLEQMLTGAIERTGLTREPITDAMELGKKGLAATLNPGRIKKFGEDMRDAKELIKTSERADMEGGRGTPQAIDKMMALPADMMTTGDIGVRKALMNEAGWSEDQARKVTVTANPRYKWGESLVNAAKSSPVWRLLLPFSRTAVNVAEGSAERIPLIGFAVHYAQKNPELQESLSQQIAEQGLGAAVGLGAYILGANTTPEEARAWKASAIVTNMSGQYGAIAGAAFAAGLASNQGRDAFDAGTSSLLQALPLPTTEVAQEMIAAGNSYRQGEPPNPSAEYAPQRWLPDNLTPRVLKDDILGNVLPSSPPPRRVRFSIE